MSRCKRTSKNPAPTESADVDGFERFAREESRRRPQYVPTFKDYLRHLVDLYEEDERARYSEARDRFYQRLRDQYAKEKAAPGEARDG